MNKFYGCVPFKEEGITRGLDVFLFDSLDTVVKSQDPRRAMYGVSPLVASYERSFIMLKGVTLGLPGDRLYDKQGNEILLFKHAVLIDSLLYWDLTQEEFETLVIREEVVHRHVAKSGTDRALRAPVDFYITHDTLACHHGADPKVLLKALKKIKRFEYETTCRVFKMEGLERFILRLIYTLHFFAPIERLRRGHLRHLHANPVLSVVPNNERKKA